MTEYDHGRNVGLEEAAVILENYLSIIVMESIKNSENLLASTKFKEKLMPTIYQIREAKRK